MDSAEKISETLIGIPEKKTKEIQLVLRTISSCLTDGQTVLLGLFEKGLETKFQTADWLPSGP